MKQFTFIIVALLFCFSVQAQEKSNGRKVRKEEKRKKIDAKIKQEEEGVIVYKKSVAGGVKLTSDGYGGFIEKGISKSVKNHFCFN